MPIIIIESPNKREKIKSITGYDVEATSGHFMNLKDIDIENNYKTIFDYDENKKNRIYKIIEKCKNNEVFIATDPDREGYAIGYLFYEKIKNIAKAIYRAEFHEITTSGIKKGLKEAVAFSNTNMEYYNSFLGRRVIDRLIGFILSPILIKELKAKSAGRVQTPALKLIVDRYNEIQEFDKLPLESKLFYTLQAKALINNVEVILKYNKDEKEIQFSTREEAEAILNKIKDNKIAVVADIISKDILKSPPKPFTTSKLLKLASKKLKLSTDKIQSLAQELFEKGLITYIRTDSEFISIDFLKEMENYYKDIYPNIYKYTEYKAGKNSQAEAHEAIRITHCHKLQDLESILAKENITNIDSINLYRLVFLNTLSSQFKDAAYKTTKVIFNIRLEEFSLSIRSLAFKGYLEIFDDGEQEDIKEEHHLDNINLKNNDIVEIKEILIKDGKKLPPKPYLESDFIEVLEKSGIGRPSTYSTYIPKLLERNYIEIDEKRTIKPTLLGINVIDFLNKHKYKFVLDLNFTKDMENKLDLIKDKKYSHILLIKEIHSKLDFLPLKNSNTNNTSNINPPSEKQKNFCKLISTSLNIELPNNYENDWRIADKFIKTHSGKLKDK